jgi:hypothetical protein
MKNIMNGLLALALSVGAVCGQGTTIWDESVNGPLSNDYTQPTVLGTFPVGTDAIEGATQYVPTGNSGVDYEDFFTFVIPDSAQIESLSLSADDSVAVWIGTDNFSDQLSYKTNPSNGDLLAQLGTGPLGAGVYDMYVMDYDFNSGGSTANYNLGFGVQSIPEPCVFSLLVTGAVCFIGSRSRKNYQNKTA